MLVALFARAAMRVDNSDSLQVSKFAGNCRVGKFSSWPDVIGISSVSTYMYVRVVNVCAEDGQTKIPGEWMGGKAGTYLGTAGTFFSVCQWSWWVCR